MSILQYRWTELRFHLNEQGTFQVDRGGEEPASGDNRQAYCSGHHLQLEEREPEDRNQDAQTVLRRVEHYPEGETSPQIQRSVDVA